MTMIWILIGFFIILTLLLSFLVRDHLKKTSTLIFPIMSLSSLVTSSIFVVMTVSLAKEPMKTLSINGLTSNMLVGLNLILISFSFLIWFLTRNSFDRNRSSLLVEAIGAWNKIDIDNSVENLIDHGIKKPEDRLWVVHVLKILKGYKDEPKSSNLSTPPSPEEGLSK